MKPVLLTAAALVINLLMGGSTHAQDVPSVDQIVQGLALTSGSNLSKSFGSSPDEVLSPHQKLVIEGVFSLGKNIDVTVDDAEAVAAVVEEAKLPSLDFTILFDFDSAQIKSESYDLLLNLGRALERPELSQARFLVNGHTDARGGLEYNDKLSVARARAVADFLVGNFGIERNRLLPLGFGEKKLKNSIDGEAAENRRVEVVNLGG